jgi:UDP-glucose 4-epimerase
MKVLVFGAGGYIGERLVAHLNDLGSDVLVAGTQHGHAMQADTGRIDEGFSFPGGIETVIYLSQSPFWRAGAERFDHVLAVNCGAAVRLGAMAQRAGVRRFLYASTGTVYRPAITPLSEAAPLNRQDWYALSKIFAEEALANLSGTMQVTSLRLFGVYGPRQRGRLVGNLAQRIHAGLPVTLDRDPVTGEDEGLLSTMTHVEDVVTVMGRLAALDGLSPTLNLAGEHSISIRSLAMRLADKLGKTVRFEATGKVLPGHFVADVSRLREVAPHAFRSISVGLGEMDVGADLGVGA